MNFQEKVMGASAELRARAAALANAAAKATRQRADTAAEQVAGLKKTLGVLIAARREFKKVARQHARRFAKQNSPLFAAARRDVSELARSTYQTLTTGKSAKARRPSAPRKRARRAA